MGNRPLFVDFLASACIIKESKESHSMAVQIANHSHYKIEIDFPESPQHPVVYFRKCRKCTTHKGMERQHDRIVNESCEQWRDYGFRRLTVSRVPANEVATW